MTPYTKRNIWLGSLLFIGLTIIVLIVLYINDIIKNVAQNEREKVQFWAAAVKHRADLVNYSDDFFENVRKEERKRIATWAEAYKKLYNSNLDEELTFYLKIIEENTSIPVVVTDSHSQILFKKNAEDIPDSVHVLEGKLLREYSQFNPLIYKEYGNEMWVFYKESKIYTDLRAMFQNQLQAFFTDVVENPQLSIPIIITDSTQNHIIASGSVIKDMQDSAAIQARLNVLKQAHIPITLNIRQIGKTYIYYEDSYLLTQLRYYPYVLFGIGMLCLIVGYLLFNTTRRNEQNQVWVGMSKETAHQLGTPLSSLVAWVEYMKMKQIDEEITTEITKDLERLETITRRFSKIGSNPELKPEDIIKILHQSISYLKKRTSQKVQYIIIAPEKEVFIPLNAYLFEWVVENICKNGVDAMSGIGTLTIEFSEDADHAFIDISDTGKGMTKAVAKTVFNPGFTTKQRGWGVGLSIARRIIRNYHKGNISIKSTVVGKGTTFRIELHKGNHKHTFRKLKKILFGKKD